MLKDELKNLETTLMDIEMSLKAVLLNSTTSFKEKVTSIITEIKGKTDDFLQLAKDQAEIFNTDLRNHALEVQVAFIDEANANADNPEYQNNEEFDFKYEIFETRDIVLERLEKSRSTWETELGSIETFINGTTRKEWEAKAEAITGQQ